MQYSAGLIKGGEYKSGQSRIVLGYSRVHSTIGKLLILTNQIHTYNTRSNQLFQICDTRTKLKLDTILQYQAPVIFNLMSIINQPNILQLCRLLMY